MFHRSVKGALTVFSLVAVAVSPGLAQALRKNSLAKKPTFAANQYILILADAPVAERFPARDQLATAAAVNYRQQLETRQRDLMRQLGARNIRVNGSVSTLLNALFVSAPPDRVDELKNLPGVIGVR